MTRIRRNGWFGVAAVAVGSFATVLSEFLPVGLLPSIASDLTVTIGTAGLMVVVTGLAAAVAAPVVTVTTSRVDRRAVLVGLSAVLVLADAVAAIAAAFPVLLLGRVLLGVALGGFWAVGAGIASRLLPAGETIRGTSFITAGISIATVVSLPLGAFVAATSTWRLAFVIGAALGALALVLQLIALPTIPSPERIRAGALVGLFGVPRARLGMGIGVLVFAAQFAAYTFVSPFLQDSAGISPDGIAVALLVFGVSGIAGNFLSGVALSRSVPITLTIGALALAGAVALLPPASHLPVAVFALLVVWGLVWGGLPLGLQTWMVRATPHGAEAGLAMFVTTNQTAIAVGSTVGGIVVTASGLAVDFWLAAILSLLAAAVLLVRDARPARDQLAVADH